MSTRDPEPPVAPDGRAGQRPEQPSAEQQLADLAALVATGPVELGAFTQAEMAVVLGDLPALAGAEDAVLAEAVRSLAARGVLHRVPGERTAEVVGDLGLLVALSAHSIGTLEIRRGHPGPANEDWRWLVSVFGRHVVGVDQVDALGLHRLSLVSVGGVADTVAKRMADGRAKVPPGGDEPVPISDDEVRELTATAERRWQLIHRVPRAGGARLVVDALVLRTGEDRLELVTRAPEADGYQRMVVDARRLAAFMRGLFALT
jgi:hypothetical protein